MVYAFECQRCQIRVYSASPKRARGCPMCAEPMHGAPIVKRATKRRPEAAPALDVRLPVAVPPPA